MKKIEEVYTGRYAASYDGERANSKRWRRESSVIEPIIRSIPDGSRVLDVAAGTGRWLSLYAEKNIHPTLVDASSDMLSIARQKSIDLGMDCKIIQANATDDAPFEGEFDWLVVTNFFNWITLSDVKTVIRKSTDTGIRNCAVMITYIDPDNSHFRSLLSKAHTKYENFKSRVGMRDKGIYHLHTRGGVLKMFRDLNITVTKEETINISRGRRNVMIVGER